MPKLGQGFMVTVRFKAILLDLADPKRNRN